MLITVLFTISGCKDGKDNKEKLTTVVAEKKTTNNSETAMVIDNNQSIIKKAYKKLAKKDKESIVNVDDVVVNKLDINKEKNIVFVNKKEKTTGEVLKIIYKTNDPVLGGLFVYYDSSKDEIVVYGLRD